MLADVIIQREKEKREKRNKLIEANSDPIKSNIVIYQYYIYKIGGIETWLYNVAKKYSKYDITIVYRDADEKQLERLNKYVKTAMYVGQPIKCNKIFYAMCGNYIEVDAKESYQCVHADYSYDYGKVELPKFIDKVYTASEVARQGFKHITKKDIEVLYNPLLVEKPRKLLKLITASRLTHEKGKDRMIRMIKELKKKDIPFIWYVFTDFPFECEYEEVIFMKPRLNVAAYIDDADYLVQLSDTEAYCYSIQEALLLNTPIIVTKLPILKELNIDEKNAHILEFDMSNLDVNKIYNNIPKVNYTPIQSNDKWEEILGGDMKKKVLRAKKIVPEVVEAVPEVKPKRTRTKKGDK